MEKKVLDYSEILEYSDPGIEYCFVDKAEVCPGEEAWGTKLASMQDWYFKFHFPGNPMMPGIFVMESIMMTGALAIHTLEGKKNLLLLFNGCKDMRMYRSVRPGDIVNTHVVIESYKHGVIKSYGEAYVENQIVCKLNFMHIAPDEMPEMKKKDEVC